MTEKFEQPQYYGAAATQIIDMSYSIDGIASKYTITASRNG
jgi:hypothetical protein